MKSQICKLLLAGMILAGSIFAAAQSTVFRYRPGRVAIGTVYHYLKTNVDGSQPENISLYIAGQTRIESFKFHEKGTRAGLVTAEMDWTTFSPKKLESWQVFSKDDRKLFATLTFDPTTRTVDVLIPALKADKEVARIGSVPFHLYNFDLASLNVSFPHLVKATGSFTVGIADPTFRSEGPMFAYKGPMTVKFEKEETRNGSRCRRYSASGPGIGGGGTIWVNKSGNYIVDMEFDVANNPEWRTFKLKLVKEEKMDAEGWQRFIASHF